MKTLKLILLPVALTVLLGACAGVQWGVARLPDARELFITTAGESVFVARKDLVIPYQPVGFVEIRSVKNAACQSGMADKYTSLEKAISEDLIAKAHQELGGDAVVDFQWSVTSTADMWLEAAAILAADPYTSTFMMLMYPVALLGNQNIITMKGTVVKKK